MLSFCPRPAVYGIDTSQPPKDRYRIIGRIAAGSMAQVYLAELRTNRGPVREVALKRLRPELQSDHHFVQMFFDEARTASEMDHQNIARIVELGEIDGSFFMAIELVYGASLRTIARRLRIRKEAFPLPILMRIAASALEGLAYAHQASDPDGRPLRIVHRDVSPQNILVSFDGEVKLIDFGVAKAERNLHKTMPGLVKGTFAYMAPEQIRGEAIDGRADLFAFGETLYEAATLHHPFFDPPETAKLDAVFTQDPFDPTRFVRRFPPRVRDILFKALTRDVRDRYADADEMRDAIETLLLEAPSGDEDVAAFVRSLFVDAYALMLDSREKRDPELLVRALRADDPSKATADIMILEPATDAAIPILTPTEQSAPRALIEAPRPQLEVRRLTSGAMDTIPPNIAEPMKLAPKPEWALKERVPSAAGIEAYVATWTGRFGMARRGILKRAALDAPRSARDAIIHEGRLLGILGHSGFRALYDAGEYDGRPYLVAENNEGFNFREIFERCTETKNEIPAALACWLLAELASLISAMTAARTPEGDPLNLVLDDLSPSSARFTVYGMVQVDDLVYSRSKLGNGMSSSEPSIYRPPVSDFPESNKSRTIYALGAILYESILLPHLDVGSEPLEQIIARTQGEPFGSWRLPIALSEPVLSVVSRAIALNPADRYANVHAFELDLQRVLLRLGQPITRSYAATWVARLLSA